MLEIKLERALTPDDMREQPCGICGADFEPGAVLVKLVTVEENISTCETCLAHLAHRAEDEPIPADWNDVYWRYVAAVEKYPEPVFPSMEAALEFEDGDPRWEKIRPMMQV